MYNTRSKMRKANVINVDGNHRKNESEATDKKGYYEPESTGKKSKWQNIYAGNKKYRDKKRKASKESYEANKKQILAKAKESYQLKKKQILEKNKESYQVKKKQVQAKARATYNSNPTPVLHRMKAKYHSNDNLRESNLKRRRDKYKLSERQKPCIS